MLDLRLGDQDAMLHRLAERVAQLALRQVDGCLEQRVPDFTSGCRRLAQHALRPVIQAGNTLQEKLAQPARQPNVVVAGGEELLGEEGVALRPGKDRVRHGRGQGRTAAGRDERCQLVSLERTELENERRRGSANPVDEPRHPSRRGGFVCAVRREEEHRAVLEVVREVDDKVERRVVGPVHVLEHEQHGDGGRALGERRERLVEHLQLRSRRPRSDGADAR